MSARILFIAPSAYPLGGVQTWLDYIVTGVDSTIALTEGVHHNIERYLITHPFKNFIRIANVTGTIQGRIKALESILLEQNPDIIVVVNIVDTYRAVNNLRKKGVLNAYVVTSLHGIHSGLIDDVNSYRNVIDAVITTNKLTRKLVIEKTKFNASRVLYAPYGVSNDAEKNSVPSRTTSSDRPFTMAYVGRLEEDQKRVNDLLSIFTEILNRKPETRILVAGDGPDLEKFNTWRALVSADVQYLGVLSPEQLYDKVYAVSDVLLLTSSWETGPIVAWEAMQHGVTLVCSKYIGYAEEGSLIDDENCLMFDVGDIDAAVKKLMVAHDTNVRKAINKESQLLVKSKYTVTKSISAWNACFKTILQKQAKPYSPQLQLMRDEGRLNTFLGMLLGDNAFDVAENVRRLFKTHYQHQEAGSEWPHSYSKICSKASELVSYLDNSADAKYTK